MATLAILPVPMSIVINILLVLQGLVAVLMMFVILMQRPKSEGLGAAFGGGVTENIFGAQTTNVLTTITSWLAGIFFALALGLSVLYAHRGAPSSAVRRELMKTSGTTAPAAPNPAKAAAEKAAADAKANLNPQANATPAPAAKGTTATDTSGAATATPVSSPQPTP